MFFLSPGERTIGGFDNGTTRTAVDACPTRSYCVNGTVIPCPPGTFGCAKRLGTPACNGPCAPGFFCPAGSGSNKEFVCGGLAVFCPAGVGAPVNFTEGFYTAGGPVDTQQSSQRPCEPGSYCVGGVKVGALLCGPCEGVFAPRGFPEHLVVRIMSVSMRERVPVCVC